MSKLRTYKYLTQEEITYYRRLDENQIELEKDKMRQSLYYRNIPMNQIRLDVPFYVINGDWDGVIYKENDKYYMNIIVELKGDSWIDTKNITEQYLKGIPSGLDINHVIDEKRYDEFYKIYTDKTTYLNSADENCDHEIVGGDNYSGIKCSKCTGWYCA